MRKYSNVQYTKQRRSSQQMNKSSFELSQEQRDSVLENGRSETENHGIDRKLVIDPQNVSSFYAVNPEILKMPLLKLKSLNSLEKNGNHGHTLDKNWLQITSDVYSPFPKNRVIIKKKLEEQYGVTFEEEESHDEGFSPQARSSVGYSPRRRINENCVEILKKHPANKLRNSALKKTRNRSLEEIPNTLDSFFSQNAQPINKELNERTPVKNSSSKKKLLPAKPKLKIEFKNQHRRKSCHCSDCGGKSKFENIIDNHPLITRLLQVEKEKEVVDSKKATKVSKYQQVGGNQRRKTQIAKSQHQRRKSKDNVLQIPNFEAQGSDKKINTKIKFLIPEERPSNRSDCKDQRQSPQGTEIGEHSSTNSVLPSYSNVDADKSPSMANFEQISYRGEDDGRMITPKASQSDLNYQDGGTHSRLQLPSQKPSLKEISEQLSPAQTRNSQLSVGNFTKISEVALEREKSEIKTKWSQKQSSSKESIEQMMSNTDRGVYLGDDKKYHIPEKDHYNFYKFSMLGSHGQRITATQIKKRYAEESKVIRERQELKKAKSEIFKYKNKEILSIYTPSENQQTDVKDALRLKIEPKTLRPVSTSYKSKRNISSSQQSPRDFRITKSSQKLTRRSGDFSNQKSRYSDFNTTAGMEYGLGEDTIKTCRTEETFYNTKSSAVFTPQGTSKRIALKKISAGGSQDFKVIPKQPSSAKPSQKVLKSKSVTNFKPLLTSLSQSPFSKKPERPKQAPLQK